MPTFEGLSQTNGAEANLDEVRTKFSATHVGPSGCIEYRINAARRIRGQTECVEADSGLYEPSGGGWDLQSGEKLAMT